MTDQHYPYPDGDFTDLGPGVFASSDGKTISWRGDNYERQEAARITPDNSTTGSAPADNPLRQRVARAIHGYDNHHALSGNDIPSKHHFGEADAALTVLRPELARLAALRQVARDYCFTCGRGDAAPTVADWETQYDRADTAEQRLGKVRDLRDDLRGVTGARWIADALDSILDQPQEQPAARHDDGPTVEEAAKIDRNWDVEKGGE